MGMTMTEIDHQTEAAEAAPHEMGCWEVYAEEVIEAGNAQTGTYDEILSNGMRLVDSFHYGLLEGLVPCRCQVTHRVDDEHWS